MLFFLLQLQIECFDSAYPLNKDTSNVTITVRRNINPPIFQFPRYTQRIPETWGLGQEVVRVSATDADGDRITYSITGDAFGTTTRANEYYYIGADTGIISLKKPLTVGTQVEDNVSVNVVFYF
jgi:hypothetical protein